MLIEEFNTLFAWEAYDLKEWIVHRQSRHEPVITPLTWIKMIYGNTLADSRQRFGWFQLLLDSVAPSVAFRQMGQALALENERLPILCLFVAGAASPNVCQVDRCGFYSGTQSPGHMLPPSGGVPVVVAGSPQLYLYAFAPSAPGMASPLTEQKAMAVFHPGAEGRGIASEFIQPHDPTTWRANPRSLYAESFFAGYIDTVKELQSA